MSEEIYNTIGQEMMSQFCTSVGQMFGKPCLKTTGKKAFVILN
jgi:chemotaxis protein CheY-P-specific phosphatase CheC